MDRYLVLENGRVFKGKAFGAEGSVIAEIVFTTGMTGYLETLTDKSYTGQVVVQTFPLIGNYGVIPEDFEGELIGPCGYIVREKCDNPSNFRCEDNLDSLLKKRGIPGLYGIDTRALTRIIREHGVMNGQIIDDPEKADMDAIRAYRATRPIDKVTSKEIRREAKEGAAKKVVLYDFGLKENIQRCLVGRGCDVCIVPAHTPAKDTLAMEPDGIFFSNGPGDPEDNTEVIEIIRELFKSKVPMMGICMGHQLMALANGFSTHKLKYGHRGANQPVRDTFTGRTYISSQNHGYAVTNESINPDVADVLFENVNDGTNEGLIYKNHPAFSVQFHPEAAGGPKDTEFLFDKFIEMMEVR